ncbi:MAG: cytochrome-c peroxidase [Deltaproteobacteria bacterium]|nr:cytochrome-c peroxidase [Deltaproteobacteria bacterium]
MRASRTLTLGAALVLVGGCGGGVSDSSTADASLHSVMRSAHITPLEVGSKPAVAKVELGRALMFDKLLSGNRDISCATCHHPLLHMGDGLPVSIGTGGAGLGPARVRGAGRNLIPRNAPEVFDRGAPLWTSMFWDSRVTGSPAAGFSTPAHAALPAGLESILAAQAMFPVTSRDEMRGARGDVDVLGQPNEVAALADNDFTGIWAALMQRVLAIPEYVTLFNMSFPDVASGQLGFQHAANAIAAFEVDACTLLDSAWDRYVAGDANALSENAKQGAMLFFGKAGCSDCHSGNLFTDQQHHDIAIPQLGPGKGSEAPLDYGRGRETGLAADRYKFRTPPLRNVAVTGPWMHDGAYATLEGAVRHHLDPATSLRNYNVMQNAPALVSTYQGDPITLAAILANLDPLTAKPRSLADAEVNDLLTFLEALTAPDAMDMSKAIPDSVPSGLPVRD